MIDIQSDRQDLPAELEVGVGDVIKFAATGGRLRSGTAIELIGILNDGVLGTDGQVLSPTGAPGTVLFLAIAAGQAVIDIVTGDPWQSPVTRSLNVLVK